MSTQAEEKLGDTLQGPQQMQQDTLWQIMKSEHTPQSTSFNTDAVDLSQQLKVGKHGKTTKAVDASVSVFMPFFWYCLPFFFKWSALWLHQ